MKKFVKTLRENFIFFLMVLPGAAWLILFFYIPVLGNVVAFKDYHITGEGFIDSVMKSKWVGFDNFKFLFSSKDAYIITRNTVLYNLAFIFLGLIVYSAGAADFVLNVMGLGVDEFGWLMIPMVVAGMTGSWACSHLLAMFGQNRLLFWGVGFLAASGLFGVVFDHGPFAVFPWVLLAPVVYNFAAAAVRPALNVMNLDYFPKSRGLAASVQQFFQTGAFAVSSALLIPIVLGEAWKYAAVMLGSGLIALVLLLVVRRTRPAALAAAEAEELAEDELRIKPTKLS